jgi:prepilin-type N-terminal cleavage/methylation domain-containing protein
LSDIWLTLLLNRITIMRVPLTQCEAKLAGRRSRGFTLVELLVVIGIIGVLISILLPVISHVRTTSYVASTQNQLLVIQNAIEAYRQNFEAYPGPLPDSEIVPATVPPVIGFAATSSENLVLGLLGGLQMNAATGAITYSSALVGSGPLSLNRLKTQRYQAYGDPVSAGLDPIKDTTGAWLPWSNSQHSGVSFQGQYKDTQIPEFVDRFPDAMPILYVRARVGATGVVTDGATTFPTGTTAAYNQQQLAPYTFPKLPMPPSQNPPFNPNPPAGGFELYLPEYFGTFSDPRKPRQRDGYMLIAAGADRKYGTADDVTNTGKLK